MKPILITIIFIIGGTVLLGLPSAVILQISIPFIVLFLGPEASNLMRTEAAWLIAIVLSILWPLAITPAYYITRLLKGGRFGDPWIVNLALIGIVVVWTIACSVVLANFFWDPRLST